ncbi:MAG: hypothetical protein JNL74_12610, partial [Fibrobacteres bacterium]|nr:hypothetical protein [Fibrobacterota bacterium]
MVKFLLSLATVLFIFSCSENKVTGAGSDGVGPSIMVDSSVSGFVKLGDSGSTFLDSVVLYLKIKDADGIEYASASV